MKASSDNIELEVKIALSHLEGIEEQLRSMGGELINGRTYEINLRFDDPTQELTRTRQVLRLRRDVRTYLTYKSPGTVVDGVQQRTEIEIEIDDFDRGRQFLEALGYQVSMIYEKYRTMYSFHQVIVCLDEMPYGYFIELEGENSEDIRSAAQSLTLPWDAAIGESYAAIFERLRRRLGFTFRDLTFDNFKELKEPLTTIDIPIVRR